MAVGYKSRSIVDKENVKVELQFPVAAFLYNISIWPAFIVPKKLIEKQGEAFWKNPVGTGPFKVKEFKRGSHITFERNPNYWDKGKPYLDEVRFNFATDSNSRILSLKDSQAQIVDGIPFSQVNSLKGDKSLALQTAKVPLFVALWLNHKRAAAGRPQRPPGDAARARQRRRSTRRSSAASARSRTACCMTLEVRRARQRGQAVRVRRRRRPRRLMASPKFADGFSTIRCSTRRATTTTSSWRC